MLKPTFISLLQVDEPVLGNIILENVIKVSQYNMYTNSHRYDK